MEIVLSYFTYKLTQIMADKRKVIGSYAPASKERKAISLEMKLEFIKRLEKEEKRYRGSAILALIQGI